MTAVDKKITAAIQQLSDILPLKVNRDLLSTESRQVYQAILNTFIVQGRTPSLAELNTITAHPDQAILDLSEKDMVVTNFQGEMIGAYPFTMEERKYRVEQNGHTVYVMCALDALAPGAMGKCKSRVVSECAVTGQPVMIEMDRQTILNLDENSDVSVGINWQATCATEACADSLCTEMIFLKRRETTSQWQAVNPEYREVFSLPEAAQFSAGFFVPLMDN